MNKILSWDDIKYEPNAIRIDDHGFVFLKSVYGNDREIASAARVSYGYGTKSISDDESLIRTLVRNRHTSPIEQVCCTFIIKLPIFIMRQLVRHRTAKLNEYSGRYSIMSDDFYVPQEIRQQSSSNKQGSEGIVDDQNWLDQYIADTNNSNQTYQYALSKNISREMARIGLPQSIYTICQWQMDLHNLMHFLKLRMDRHAQIEMQNYANAIYTLTKQQFPITMKAFDDYILNSINFSSSELNILRDLLKDTNLYKYKDYTKFNMSRREIDEFNNKLDKLNHAI